MSREICGYCESGQDAYLNPCSFCGGTGFERRFVLLPPVTDPIALAKKVMKVQHCRCDLVEGDSSNCPFHTAKDTAIEGMS